MKKKKYKKSSAVKVLKEPDAEYTKPSSRDKQFMIFKSFEEEEEFRYRQLAMLSPEEHLSNAVKWIRRLYKGDLERNPELGTNFRIG